MIAVVKDYMTGAGSVLLNRNWVYVFREGPDYNVNDAVGIESPGEYGGNYSFDLKIDRDYKLFEGKNLASVTELVAFGVKKGRDLIIASDVKVILKNEPEPRLLSEIVENINGDRGVPVELLITGDMNKIPFSVDLNETPINIKY